MDSSIVKEVNRDQSIVSSSSASSSTHPNTNNSLVQSSSSSQPGFDVNNLPNDVREKLAELELELSEGDITQKGYEKKKGRLLAPFISNNLGSSDGQVAAGQVSENSISNQVFQVPLAPSSPSTRAKRRQHRRVTRHESRYHSEVRQEAVQQALAAMQSKSSNGKSNCVGVPMPSKRSTAAMSPVRGHNHRSHVNESRSRRGQHISHSGHSHNHNHNRSHGQQLNVRAIDDSESSSEEETDSFLESSDHAREEESFPIHYHQQHHHGNHKGHNRDNIRDGGHGSRHHGISQSNVNLRSSHHQSSPLAHNNITSGNSSHVNNSSNNNRSSAAIRPVSMSGHPQPFISSSESSSAASTPSTPGHDFVEAETNQIVDSRRNQRSSRHFDTTEDNSPPTLPPPRSDHARPSANSGNHRVRESDNHSHHHHHHHHRNSRHQDRVESGGDVKRDSRQFLEQSQVKQQNQSGHNHGHRIRHEDREIIRQQDFRQQQQQHSKGEKQKKVSKTSQGSNQLGSSSVPNDIVDIEQTVIDRMENIDVRHDLLMNEDDNHDLIVGSHQEQSQQEAPPPPPHSRNKSNNIPKLNLTNIKRQGSGGSVGSSGHGSSSSSSNEKPPEKPPERISSKNHNNNIGQLNQLDMKIKKNVTPPGTISQQSPLINQQLINNQPDVTQSPLRITNPLPLPPRLASPNVVQSDTGAPPPPPHHGHHSPKIRGQSPAVRSGAKDNRNSFVGGPLPPVPDYDAVMAHSDSRSSDSPASSSGLFDSRQHSSQVDNRPSNSHGLLDNRVSGESQSLDGYSTSTSTARWRVSAKIQHLLETLSRPKKRPLHEHYIDDETELEAAANQVDPSCPKPEGSIMAPVIAPEPTIPTGLPKSLEEALKRYGSATFKAPAVTVLDTSGKILPSFTYGKLFNRSRKVAYNLLNKVGNAKGVSGHHQDTPLPSPLKPGDRIALVYPNNDPFGFMTAFYGCLTAGIVPVPIEVPLTKRDAGCQQIGFLLGSCNVSYALTSEACFKGLPKTTTSASNRNTSAKANSASEVELRGWPRLTWLIADSWSSKPPKDWSPAPRISEDAPAYIEYTVDKEGAMKGVSVSRSALINHSRSLTAACDYTEGDVMVSVLDFKREVGLWHSVLTSILNGMHVIFIPYSLMKMNPSSWMLMITKYKATVAICKSRDLHWGLLATRDHKDVNLSSLKMLLVADGSNPWSLSSCDQFVHVFNSRGLKPEAICPCAASSEALTLSIRRPGRTGVGATGRGVLSMSALSYGVIRVDQENSLTSLTLQDCGHILPGASAVVVKINGPPALCKTDEVGEICLDSNSAGTSYWGLTGLTNNIFRCAPLNDDGSIVRLPVPVSANQPESSTNRAMETRSFVRSGLLGFMGPGSLVFICGTRDGLMQVSGRKHNTDDLIATVLAVEPMKFVYRGRICIFGIKVLRDERICVVAEQRPDCTEEESFQWMSRVLQAVDSIHQVGIYCIALVPPNQLPKTPLGGIHLAEVKRRYLEGSLHPVNVLMCPHTCVTNLPKPREVHSRIGPASVMVGNIVQGNRLAVAQGRDVSGAMDELGIPLDGPSSGDLNRKYQFMSEILKWRASSTPDHNLLTLLNAKGGEEVSVSCLNLYKRAERVACFLLEKGLLNTGDHVALIYPPGVDLIAAFYACLFLGVVPVTIRPPHPANLATTLPTVRMIVDVSKSVLVLSTIPVIKLLKSKEAGNVIDIKTWVPILDTDDVPKKKLTSIYRAPTAEMLAYLDFSVSTTGSLAGIKISHAAATSSCRSIKMACELYPSRHVALCLDPYCGLGFVLWVLNSVYSGHHSILIPPSEVESNPGLWLTAVSQYKVRDTFCSYGVLEMCSKGLSSAPAPSAPGSPAIGNTTSTSIQALKARNVNLSCVRTCVVVAEERPRVNLTTSFSKLFSSLGLSPRAVSTSFGCRINVGLCLQGASSPDPTTVFVDMRALRNDRVTLVERGAPHSLCLIESGKLLPGVKVVIANPETGGHCGDSNLGEIWVQSPFNASGYFQVYGDESTINNDHFNARLTTGDTSQTYARTGYLGFLRRTESVQADGELHDAVFVVGALDETIMLRGMRYHPIDIENSVLRCHKKVAECAVFTWTNLLVVVAELCGAENEALDLVPLITNVILEEHHLIVGVVVVVDPGIIPINSRGEKQRMHLRDGFLADQLDPIYVAYNM